MIKDWWRGIQVASCETERGLSRSLQAGQNDVHLCGGIKCMYRVHAKLISQSEVD